MKGWILLYRSICENLLWNDKPFAKGQAWIDLIMMANYEPKKKLIGNKVVTVEAGSLYTSLGELSERWGWGKHKTLLFLDLLEAEQMISKKGNTQGTIISIENYSDFQDAKKAKGNMQGMSTKRAGNACGKPSYLYKELKEIKEVKEVYGELDNVLLTIEEYEKLKERFPLDYMERVDKLSEYIASKGDKYKSHYATILSWSRNDKVKEKKQERRRSFMDL